MWHEKRDITVNEANSDEKWQPNDNYTKTVLSDSFGAIEFRGFGHEANRAAPVRCFCFSLYRNMPENGAPPNKGAPYGSGTHYTVHSDQKCPNFLNN